MEKIGDLNLVVSLRVSQIWGDDEVGVVLFEMVVEDPAQNLQRKTTTDEMMRKNLEEPATG